jgi:hypothetical protein
MKLKKEMLALAAHEEKQKADSQSQSSPESYNQSQGSIESSNQSQESYQSISSQSTDTISTKASTGDMTLESSTEYYRKRGEEEEDGFDQMEKEDTSEDNGTEDPDFANKKDVSPEELETGSGEIGPPIQKFSSGDYSTTTGKGLRDNVSFLYLNE